MSKLKKIVTSEESSHMESLLGETVTLFCCRYIYSGKLVSVDEYSVCLEDAGIVYETGELKAKDWKDRQGLPNKWHVALSSIESFGILKV